MVLDSTLDAYGISLAFYIYNILWDIFVSTGFVYIPIIALIFSSVRSASESSMEDYNTKSALRKVGMGLLFILLALEFALYPMVNLKFDDIQYFSRQCTTDKNTPGTITTEILGEEAEFMAENMQVQLGGRQIKVPLLFSVAIRIGQGIKNWGVSDLPCTTDIRIISDGMLSQRIPDEILVKETRDFIRWCYNPGKRKYMDERNFPLSDAQDWPGSFRLLQRSGIYDNAHGDGFYSKVARDGFGKSVNKLVESEQLPDGYGFPTCKEWWLGVGVINTPYVAEESLSKRLYDSLEMWLKDKEQEIHDTLVVKLNRVKKRNYMFISIKDAVVMQSLFTPIKLEQLNSLSTNDYGLQGDDGVSDWAFRAIGTIGVMGKSIEQFSGASMLQLAMPMVKPFIIMLIIISYLPAMVMGQFRWKYIGLFHGVIMSIMFWPFFWETSRLIDDTMLTALGVDWDEVNTQVISQWIASGMYLYAPLIFSTALGWVGMVSADGAFQKMAGAPGSAGQKGVGEAKKRGGQVKKGLTKQDPSPSKEG